MLRDVRPNGPRSPVQNNDRKTGRIVAAPNYRFGRFDGFEGLSDALKRGAVQAISLFDDVGLIRAALLSSRDVPNGWAGWVTWRNIYSDSGGLALPHAAHSPTH